MNLTPRLRKLALMAHVVSSVGWLGAITCFLALALVGLGSLHVEIARSVDLALGITYTSVIVPLGVVSTLSGIVCSLGTEWGLVKHYWVLLKVMLTVPAMTLLLLHTRPVAFLATAALDTVTSASSPADLRRLRMQLTVDALAALLVLLIAVTLSIYKPRGRTTRATKSRR